MGRRESDYLTPWGDFLKGLNSQFIPYHSPFLIIHSDVIVSIPDSLVSCTLLVLASPKDTKLSPLFIHLSSVMVNRDSMNWGLFNGSSSLYDELCGVQDGY